MSADREKPVNDDEFVSISHDWNEGLVVCRWWLYGAIAWGLDPRL
ncbi:hypothetical protein [Candidatus Poriferisodalis sp.]